MTQALGTIHHALAAAHTDLIAVLEKGIAEYKKNGKYSNADQVCRSIERFVDALCTVPNGREELRSRAGLIERRCGPGTDYEQARTQALASYRGRPRKLSASKLAIDRLRKSKTTPLLLEEIFEERQEIECVLNDRKRKLSGAARESFESWRSACREVQREAEPLDVDGCWFLFHVHEAGEGKPSDRTEIAKSMLQTDVGTANLETIKAAVGSVLNWASYSGSASPDLVEPAQPSQVVEAYVDLQQMAAIVNKSKRTLERLRDNDKLPTPAVKGGKGRADEWRWSEVRPVLESKYRRQLPEVFPGDRFVRR